MSKFHLKHYSLGRKLQQRFLLLKSSPGAVQSTIKLSTPRGFVRGLENNFDFGNHWKFTRSYGTRGDRIFSSEHAANQFVRWLLPEERSTLLAALKDHEFENEALGKGVRFCLLLLQPNFDAQCTGFAIDFAAEAFNLYFYPRNPDLRLFYTLRLFPDFSIFMRLLDLL